jgi:hypothetical protein
MEVTHCRGADSIYMLVADDRQSVHFQRRNCYLSSQMWYGVYTYVMTNLNVVLTSSPQHNVSYDYKYKLI